MFTHQRRRWFLRSSKKTWPRQIKRPSIGVWRLTSNRNTFRKCLVSLFPITLKYSTKRLQTPHALTLRIFRTDRRRLFQPVICRPFLLASAVCSGVNIGPRHLVAPPAGTLRNPPSLRFTEGAMPVWASPSALTPKLEAWRQQRANFDPFEIGKRI